MRCVSTIWRRHVAAQHRRVSGFRGVTSAKRGYSVQHEARMEKVDVPVGSSGAITLSIYKSTSSNPTPPLILSISSLISTNEPPNPSPVPYSLLQTSNIITISPSWSAKHPFPYPLHATLCAYDWILQNLPPSPIALYGTDLGGTLATSLALTESRLPSLSAANPTGIRALAVKDAIFDWTSIASTPLSSSSAQDPTMKALFDLRTQLFSAPASAFDTFASPMLFFRSSGLSAPAEFPTEEAEDSSVTGKPGRKSHFVFPPRKSRRMIPFARLGVTEGNGQRGNRLRSQAKDMVGLMRRSVAMHESKERLQRGEYWEVNVREEAERRVEFVGVGDEEEDGEGEWAAEWLRDVLEEDIE